MVKEFFKNKIKHNRGMTLIELMVVISIFVIVSGLTMFDFKNFNSNTSLSNLTDDIALSIRKAQSYAIGTRLVGTKSDAGYGIHITTADPGNNTAPGSNKSFILFTDLSARGRYSYAVGDTCGSPTINHECAEVLNINTSDRIISINVTTDLGFTNYTTIYPNSTVDIVFERPNPTANFCLRKNNTPGSSCDISTASSVDIVVSNGQSGADLKTKTITVYNTGQINIQ